MEEEKLLSNEQTDFSSASFFFYRAVRKHGREETYRGGVAGGNYKNRRKCRGAAHEVRQEVRSRVLKYVDFIPFEGEYLYITLRVSVSPSRGRTRRKKHK